MPLKLTTSNHVAVLNKWASDKEQQIGTLNLDVSGHTKEILALQTAQQNAVMLQKPIAFVGQGASISSTPLTASDKAGARLYRVNYYIVVSQAATTSSSVTLTLTWNDGVLSQTSTTASPTNTLGSYVSGSVVLYGAASQTVSYSTTYASSGATSMQYALFLRVEPI
jgi:hypothetical protein